MYKPHPTTGKPLPERLILRDDLTKLTLEEVEGERMVLEGIKASTPSHQTSTHSGE
jgi:hypothetical protein